MKILSMNFVKESDVPQRTRESEGGKIAEQILLELKKVPAGHSLAIKASGAQRWERYQLQKRLQKRGAKVVVSEKDGVFYVKRVA